MRSMTVKPGSLLASTAGWERKSSVPPSRITRSTPCRVDSIKCSNCQPLRNAVTSLIGLIGGETSFLVTNLAAALSHINGGKLRALGVTSKTEAPQLPGVPPIANTLPGFENTGWFGIVAPTGTPKEIIEKVYRDTKVALDSTEMKARFFAQGMAPVGNSPDEFGKAMKEETQMWAKIVRERNISVK